MHHHVAHVRRLFRTVSLPGGRACRRSVRDIRVHGSLRTQSGAGSRRLRALHLHRP